MNRPFLKTALLALSTSACSTPAADLKVPGLINENDSGTHSSIEDTSIPDDQVPKFNVNLPEDNIIRFCDGTAHALANILDIALIKPDGNMGQWNDVCTHANDNALCLGSIESQSLFFKSPTENRPFPEMVLVNLKDYIDHGETLRRIWVLEPDAIGDRDPDLAPFSILAASFRIDSGHADSYALSINPAAGTQITASLIVHDNKTLEITYPDGYRSSEFTLSTGAQSAQNTLAERIEEARGFMWSHFGDDPSLQTEAGVMYAMPSKCLPAPFGEIEI